MGKRSEYEVVPVGVGESVEVPSFGSVPRLRGPTPKKCDPPVGGVGVGPTTLMMLACTREGKMIDSYGQ